MRHPVAFSLQQEELETMEALKRDFRIPKTQIVAYGIRLANKTLRSGSVDDAGMAIRLSQKAAGTPAAQ